MLWVHNFTIYLIFQRPKPNLLAFFIHATALRYSTGESEFRESAVRLSAALINVRAIGQHFKPKVEMWLETQKLSTPTQDQV